TPGCASGRPSIRSAIQFSSMTWTVIGRSRMLDRLLVFAGLLLIAAAGLASGQRIERALLGASTGELQWGPDLFRALLALHGMLLLLTGVIRTRSRRPDAGQSPPLAYLRADDPGVQPTPWLWLVVLTAVALAMRLWKLNTGLWLDEILTLTS